MPRRFDIKELYHLYISNQKDSFRNRKNLKNMRIENYNMHLNLKYADLKNQQNNEERNCGWEILFVDLKALEDFYMFSDCFLKKILTDALRYTIPQVFYDMAIEYNDMPTQKYLSEVESLDMLKNYKDFVQEHECIVDNEYKFLHANYTWKISSIDYYAAAFFKNECNITYKEILKNALRVYLKQSNYDYAKVVIEIMDKHIKEFLLGDDSNGKK